MKSLLPGIVSILLASCAPSVTAQTALPPAVTASLHVPDALAMGNRMNPDSPGFYDPSSAGVRTAPAAPPSTPFAFERWVDIKSAAFSLRYRNTADVNGARVYDQGSERTVFDGRIRFDGTGKYALVFHVSSGHYFDWSYSDFMGGGLDEVPANVASKFKPSDLADLYGALGRYPNQFSFSSGGWSLYMRRLYLDAAPVKGLEFQYGSLDLNRGAGSEITTYDDDGYLPGERILLRDPKHLYFDEVSLTYGFLGDLFQPNYFSRLSRMGEGNYSQVLARKTFFRRIDASVDFTDATHSKTLREAAFLPIPGTGMLDSVRCEAYQRPAAATFYGETFKNGYGYAVTAAKTIHKRLDLQGGFAAVDWNYDVYDHNAVVSLAGYALNGDSYNDGHRIFAKPTIHLADGLTASGFYTHLVGYNYASDGYLWNKQNIQAGLNYDAARLFHRGASVK